MNTMDVILAELNYAGSDGLVTPESGDVAPGRAYVWKEVREKLGVDAVYFHQNVPVVYFKQLQHVDDHGLRQLHKRLWNHNRAPLLIAILPAEVRVYDCYAPPAPELASDASTIIAKIQILSGAVDDLQALARYRRDMLGSAQFARAHHDRFNSRDRVDQRLLRNLRYVRDDLVANGLSRPVAHSLLGRSIFIRYLEDRGVIASDYYHQFGDANQFVDLLSLSKVVAYVFFDELAIRFNGDMFPIGPDEREQVTDDHLRRLGQFLEGAELSTGQLYFWAYDFNYIPIELISSIYETFLDSNPKDTGVYYTPPSVVDFVLDRVLPWEGDITDLRILDPACGSGAFLVEAFRRLVMRRLLQVDAHDLPYDELSSILTNHIFGVDMSADALSIAAFSCYLALLDFVEPKSVWKQVRFPKLIGSNLQEADFFDVDAPFNRERFSVVVGNPPWNSKLTDHAQSFVRTREYRIGNKEIAQAFLWRAPDVLTSDGQIGFLAPSKALLFNQSGPNVAFRRQFFEQHDVQVIADFTQFQSGLFANALAPMAAVFYRPRQDGQHESDTIQYLSMQLTPQSKMLSGFTIAGDEVKLVSKPLAMNRTDIWKLALYGTARDLALIDFLRARFPTIGETETQRDWWVARGFQVRGRDRRPAPAYLTQLPYVETKDIRPFNVISTRVEGIDAPSFHRLPNPRLYRAPHVLITIRSRRVTAAYIPFDASFSSPVGIATPQSDAALLKQVCAYLNSSLGQYFYFLTSGMWGIERGRMDPSEYRSLPIALLPDDHPLARELVRLVDHLVESPPTTELPDELDQLVFEAYELSEASRQLIRDTTRITLDRFRTGLTSRAFNAPSDDDMVSYAMAFGSVINETIATADQRFQSVVYGGQSSLKMVTFQLRSQNGSASRPVIKSVQELDRALIDLDSALRGSHDSGLHLSRHVKFFDADAVHIVKPSELRHWTQSSGYQDADETIGHLLAALQAST